MNFRRIVLVFFTATEKARMHKFRFLTSSGSKHAALVAGIFASSYHILLDNRPVTRSSPSNKVYTPEEVRKMDGVDGNPLWVTYRGEVFDMTKFRVTHPGGNLIEQAAGKKYILYILNVIICSF